MARRNPSLLDTLAQAPWPLGLAASAAVLVAGHVLPAVLSRSQNPFLSTMGAQLAGGALDVLLWMLAGVCWLGALISLLGRKKRKQLLEAQTGLDTLRAMSWRELEQLVSEAYRRQGYEVEETGRGGADGGVDLVLRRDGRLSLVQCKHWRTQRVGVPVVREQFGLLTHHRADAAIIVTTGDFTTEAAAFAEGKPIELMAGPALWALVQSVQRQATPAMPMPAIPANAEAADSPEPACPRCSAPMVRRTARKTNADFFGCSRYPACRGTRPV